MTENARYKNELPAHIQNLPDQESYATLEMQNQGEKAQINEAIQIKIDNVLKNKAQAQH